MTSDLRSTTSRRRPPGRGLLVSLARTSLALTSVTLVAAGVVAPSASAAGRTDGTWGATHVLYGKRVSEEISQATSSRGTTVAVFRTHQKTQPVKVAVQQAGKPWAKAVPLSDGPVARPTVIAWGRGMVSVIWQSPAGTDNYLFHLRTLSPDGTWQDAERLTTATYAYPVYQAAINDQGAVALAWSNGDLHDRVAVRDAGGHWFYPPALPVVHPTYQGFQFISNPRNVFLDGAGRVTVVTWGNLNGSGRVLWLLHLTDSHTWQTERIAPIRGSMLGYGWVPQAHVASDAGGDLAVVFSQQAHDSKRWTTMVRYRPADGTLGQPRVLTHERCDKSAQSCGDLAVTRDGTTLLAWPSQPGEDTLVVNFSRRSPSGAFSEPQTVSDPLWDNAYLSRTVSVSANALGDAVVSYDAGDRQSTVPEFARCRSGRPCESPLTSDAPDWLDSWLVTLGPRGGSTVTWVRYYRAGVLTRHLAPLSG